jgi:transcriptional regulator with XRE-family HTH domain
MRGSMQGWLGALIAQRRRELGMTQADLAYLLGVPSCTVSVLEHTLTRWQAPVLWRLADALALPQLELALAAGIISDLPTNRQDPRPGRIGGDDPDGELSDDEIVYLLLRLDDLPAADGRLLLAIAEQRAQRHHLR